MVGTDLAVAAEARDRPLPGTEAGRLAVLARFDVLDQAAEASFDRMTALVRTVLDVPMAALCLVDRDRQWFKSHPGIAAAETPRDIAFCDHVIRAGAPFIVSDARQDSRFHNDPLVTGAPHIASYAGVPLTSRDGVHAGTLCGLDSKPRAYSPVDIDILTSLAAILVDELELRQIARYDNLTGVLARGAFLGETTQAIARRDRYGRPCALVLFDIDHFKSVNDHAGHAAGDIVLRAVTQCCARMLRANDLLGRIGGEEFGVLLPELDAASALTAAERFRAGIAAMHPATGGRVTASFGIAALTAQTQTVDEWLAAADAALFAAKRGGRDRCHAAGAVGGGADSAAA